MLYQICKNIAHECRPTYLILTRKKYPLLVAGFFNFIVMSIFIIQIYHSYLDWNLACEDIEDCMEILYPIIALICPMIVMIEFYNQDCRELISVYKKCFFVDMILLYAIQMLQIFVLLLYLIWHMPNIKNEMVHLAIIIFIYYCLYHILVITIQNVTIAFLLVMVYHYFGIADIFANHTVIDAFFFIKKESIEWYQGVGYIGMILILEIVITILRNIKKKKGIIVRRYWQKDRKML